jgi:prepilin-type N-terminal cleavage/methylation domain-containing protein
MTGDAGFGMVELLVALAICAVLAMGAGSLTTLGLKLRDRVELTAEVQQALLDLRAVSSAFAGGTWVGLGNIQGDTFELCSGLPGQAAKRLGTFSLRTNSAEYRTAFAGSAADTSVFEGQKLEYLVVNTSEQDWRTADELGGERPVAVRLGLELGSRTWSMLLWMAQPSLTHPAVRGDIRCAD